MSHAPARVVALMVIVVSVAGCAGGEEARRDAPRRDGAAPLAAPPEPRAQEENAGAAEVEATAEPVPEEASCSQKGEGIRVGSFRRPENVPRYEILQDERRGGKSACAAWLLVDTRAKSEADYALIARDIKARYADRDAVSVEFTDTSGVLDYNGAAVIFNTPAGVRHIGFTYGPPNNKGYLVRAAD